MPDKGRAAADGTRAEEGRAVWGWRRLACDQSKVVTSTIEGSDIPTRLQRLNRACDRCAVDASTEEGREREVRTRRESVGRVRRALV